MTTDSDLEEAATKYAIHKEDDRHKCPACGEETMWPKIKHDFIAGARYAAEKSADLQEQIHFHREVGLGYAEKLGECRSDLERSEKKIRTLKAENEKQASRISELEAVNLRLQGIADCRYKHRAFAECNKCGWIFKYIEVKPKT